MTSRPAIEEPERCRVLDYLHRTRERRRGEKMINDRDREILAETERQLRREDPNLARRFEGTPASATRRLLQRRLVLVATSILR